MADRFVIEGFDQFGGKHCWTTSLKGVLGYHGLHLSEEMLFGLGGGLGFIYWYMKLMPAPFIGGRYGRGTEPLTNTLSRIGAEGTILETTSAEKGHRELKKLLGEGEPAIVFVDMPYLPYLVLPEVAHFGGHTIVVYGLDEEENRVYISDRCNGPATASIDDLKKARSSKFPPFPAKNKIVRIKYPQAIGDLETGIRESIKESCAGMLNPPMKNIGLKGMKHWAETVPKWPKQFKGPDLFTCLLNLFIYIEIGGTGGSCFRPMYAQFLEEASPILKEPALNDIADMFKGSGEVWSRIARAALPDSWPTFRRIRELSLEKNRIFEEWKPGAIEEMKKLGEEGDDDLMPRAIGEIQEKDVAPLVADLQQEILELHQIESEAFEKLNSII